MEILCVFCSPFVLLSSLQATLITPEYMKNALEKEGGVMTLPSWLMKLDDMALPSVWPLRGTVENLKEHYFSGGATAYPPHGHMLEVWTFDAKPEAPLGPYDL